MRALKHCCAASACRSVPPKPQTLRRCAVPTLQSRRHVLAARRNYVQGIAPWRRKAVEEDDVVASQDAELEASDLANDANEQALQALEALGQPLADANEAGIELDPLLQDQAQDIVEVVESVVASPRPAAEEYDETEAEERQMMSPTEMLTQGVQFMRNNKAAQAGGIAVLVLLAVTFGFAVKNTWQKYQSGRAKRKRQVDKNKLLVEELAKYLPGNQAALTSSKLQALQRQTGFTAVEVFRKYLWYLLQSRKFDESAVNDLVHLKSLLALTDDDVAAALKERAQRIYTKYGSLMLNTAGMTEEGVQRKATCQALFQKLLYLTEYHGLIKQDSPAAKTASLREIFGATEEDEDRLRIVSLVDADLDKLDKMASSGMGSVSDDDGPTPPTVDSLRRKPQK